MSPCWHIYLPCPIPHQLCEIGNVRSSFRLSYALRLKLKPPRVRDQANFLSMILSPLAVVLDLPLFEVPTLIIIAALTAISIRVFYNVYLHPLAQFPGPWYASATSLTNAIISVRKAEPEWLLGLTKKYGGMGSLYDPPECRPGRQY
jgi:hypothetical protein